jgi:hypothetical protein
VGRWVRRQTVRRRDKLQPQGRCPSGAAGHPAHHQRALRACRRSDVGARQSAPMHRVPTCSFTPEAFTTGGGAGPGGFSSAAAGGQKRTLLGLSQMLTRAVMRNIQHRSRGERSGFHAVLTCDPALRVVPAHIARAALLGLGRLLQQAAMCDCSEQSECEQAKRLHGCPRLRLLVSNTTNNQQQQPQRRGNAFCWEESHQCLLVFSMRVSLVLSSAQFTRQLTYCLKHMWVFDSNIQRHACGRRMQSNEPTFKTGSNQHVQREAVKTAKRPGERANSSTTGVSTEDNRPAMQACASQL